MTDEEFLLNDLKVHLSQESWDWPADERFAEHIGSDSSVITSCINSSAPGPLRQAIALSWKGEVTSRRLRALRRLVKKGLVEADWSGTGPGGRSEFGVSRVRSYYLI